MSHLKLMNRELLTHTPIFSQKSHNCHFHVFFLILFFMFFLKVYCLFETNKIRCATARLIWREEKTKKFWLRKSHIVMLESLSVFVVVCNKNTK
jgi:hypothetical protein